MAESSWSLGDDQASPWKREEHESPETQVPFLGAHSDIRAEDMVAAEAGGQKRGVTVQFVLKATKN